MYCITGIASRIFYQSFYDPLEKVEMKIGADRRGVNI